MELAGTHHPPHTLHAPTARALVASANATSVAPLSVGLPRSGCPRERGGDDDVDSDQQNSAEDPERGKVNKGSY